MPELEEIIDFINPDEKLLRKGRERQSAVWKGIEPDYLPLILQETEAPELNNFVHYTLKDQFFNKEKMILEQLKGLVGFAKAGGDAQFSIRANLGVGVVPSIFGLKPIFTQDDQMPWFVRMDPFGKGTLSKEEVQNLDIPGDIRNRGLIPTAIEYIEYFKSKIKNGVNIYCFDTQGPFDIAHLIRGPQIYTDLYDDPEFVHRLMDISTRVYIETTKIFKEAAGEPLCSGYHGSLCLYMDGGGVRLCDDSSTNLSPHLFREFSLPYIKRALSPFGGGWVHFCGNSNHLLDMYLEVEEIKGLNFGNPEKYDYESIMTKMISKGKFYLGVWPGKKGESLKEYFQRILAPLKGRKCGLILQFSREKNELPCSEIIDLWYSLQ